MSYPIWFMVLGAQCKNLVLLSNLTKNKTDTDKFQITTAKEALQAPD